MTTEVGSFGPTSRHELLLAVAGRFGDEYVSAARDVVDLTVQWGHVLDGAKAAGLTLTEEDLTALTSHATPGDAATIARDLDQRNRIGRPQYTFIPFAAGPGRPEPPVTLDSEPSALAEAVDRTELAMTDWTDPAVTAVLEEVAFETGARGVWGAWRWPQAELSRGEATEPVRVFLVEVEERPERSLLTRRLQQVLARAGEPGTQVEVYATGDTLPDYQRLALGSSALVWAQQTGPPPEVVPVFDSVDQAAHPHFSADHPRLNERERADVAAYLYGAEAVMLTTATLADVIEPEWGAVVPLNFRTDGAFVWPEAVAYYVEQYGLEPYPPLLAAIRAAKYRPPRADGVDLFRAENVILNPSD